MNSSLPPYPAPAIIDSAPAATRTTRRLGSIASFSATALLLSACAPGAGSGGGEAPPSGTAGGSSGTSVSEPDEPVNAAQRDSRAARSPP